MAFDLLICPRQPVGQGFGSLSGVSQDISVMSAFLIVDLAFLVVDLTFHGQPHLLQVPRQPPCSDGFACFGSHPSLANGTGASIAVVGDWCKDCSSSCACRLSHLSPDLYSKGGCTRITTLGQQRTTLV